ncbi:P-loop containing nucleoside triphosphate hydrolase [Phytophthora cactorum]|nr:P-loop containing nucleoside triphosphate hydrolase [Phytophthora cactorum]
MILKPTTDGCWIQRAPGQILDNANGNLSLGVANGSRCWLHSIGWDDKALTANAMSLVDEALENRQSVVELPFPPQFINVRLADGDGNPVSRVNWPEGMNLELPENGTSDITDTHDVAIPIGYVLSNADNSSIKLTNTDGSSQEIKYSQHAVDLAMVLTVSKAQGSTFSRAILLLEGSQHAP